MLALVAFALAASKLQHMLLPLAFAVTILVLDRVRLKRTTWRAFALTLGALLGAYFQFVQTERHGLMIDTIRQYNRADVVFTALVPLADDPRHCSPTSASIPVVRSTRASVRGNCPIFRISLAPDS